MKHISLRVPDELHAALKECAAHDHRSLNSEVIAMLERAVTDHAIHLRPEGRSTLAQ